MLKIKATSVDVERIFSSSGLIVKKLRTRLSDQSIDNLLFLKHYFKNLDSYKQQFNDLEIEF